MYQLIISLCISFALLTSCGGNSSTSDSTGIKAANVAASSTNYDLSCLLEEGRSICDFLDPEVVFQYLPREAKKTAFGDMKRRSTSSCGYSHPSGKNYTIQLNGQDITSGHDMTIGIFGVKKSRSANPLAEFKAAYQTMSEEELAAAKKQMQDAVQEKVNAGEIDETTGELASGFGNLIQSMNYEAVEGVGTAAVWDVTIDEREVPTIGRLYVLAGDVNFAITADMTTSKEDSKQAAIAVALSVIQACD